MQLDLIGVLQDLSVIIGSVILFSVIVLFGRRVEGSDSVVKSYKWSFLFNSIGVAGYLFIYWIDRNVVPLGSTFSAYALPPLLLIGVTDAGGFLQFTSSVRMVSNGKAQQIKFEEKRIDEVNSTGVPELDRAVGGELPYPASVIVMGVTGSGKSTLVRRLVIKRLESGDGVLFLCLDNTPENVRNQMMLMGFDSAPFEKSKKLIFVDGYSVRAGVESREHYTTSLELSDISINISKAIEELKGKRRYTVFESITILLDESSSGRTLVFLRNLVAKMRVSHVSLLVTYNPIAFSPSVTALAQETVDGTIHLRIDETKKGLTRLILVPRLKDSCPIPNWIPITYPFEVQRGDEHSRNKRFTLGRRLFFS
ncbi:MAG: RAD55 family ATPase [Thaumarchaeota archaeon]|nr:RAD55 family ATPase [Nitrososphaerota archaeon]MCL5317984.1 RAD55 family ATPase [Nitrososphaerota archaeon]